MNQPMISCVTVTTDGRPQFKPSYLDCFVEQSYPNKQLVVVTDEGFWKYNGIGELVEEYVGEPNVLTLGEKRNQANSLCDGELIAHWDDDDYSASHRLLVQANRLEASGRAVCGLRSMYFVNQHGETHFYMGNSLAGLGTSLVYRRQYWLDNPFAKVNRGEDKKFVERASSRGQFELLIDRSLMVARHHDKSQAAVYTGVEWKPTDRHLISLFVPGFEYGEVKFEEEKGKGK